jgi:hypothetical protein
MAESQKSEAEYELGTISALSETIPTTETEDNSQSVSKLVTAIAVNMTEEPVAGKAHSG